MRDIRSTASIRKRGPTRIYQLKECFGTEELFAYGMQESSKALCQAILDTGKLHGPMTEKQQTEAIAWAYGIQVIDL